MKLNPKQTCMNSSNCPYKGHGENVCQGCNPLRDTVFTCDYLDDSGIFKEGCETRNALDKTGKMKILRG